MSTDGTEPRPDAGDRDVLAAVEQDVRDGLVGVLRAVPDAFALAEPTEGRPLVDGDLAVVAWRFTGIDDREGFNGMFPTARRITLAGVTFVDRSAEPWTFRRHVDWNGCDAQLGGSQGRASSPVLVKRREDAIWLAAVRDDRDG